MNILQYIWGITTGKLFGYQKSSFDSRDLNFAMPNFISRFPSHIPRTSSWRIGTILDQGHYPMCVGYAVAQWAQSDPTRTVLTPEFNGKTIYAECKNIDGNPTRGGTTGRAALQVLKSQGRIASYHWGSSLSDIRSWIFNRGTVLVGSYWTMDMMFTNKKTGLIKGIGGKIIGGHEYLIGWYSDGLYKIVNSWGNRWGINGIGYITEKDFEALLYGPNMACDIMGLVEVPI